VLAGVVWSPSVSAVIFKVFQMAALTLGLHTTPTPYNSLQNRHNSLFNPHKSLCNPRISLADAPIFLSDPHKLGSEIHESLAEIHISPEEIQESKRELGNFFFPTTQPPPCQTKREDVSTNRRPAPPNFAPLFRFRAFAMGVTRALWP